MEHKFRIEHFQKIRKETLKKIEEEWNLFMSYTQLADIAGHVYWGKPIMVKIYRMLDEFAREIANRLPEKCWFLIVSDHGMKKAKGGGGVHSSHAFYSSNIHLGVKNLKITDFFSLINMMLNK